MINTSDNNFNEDFYQKFKQYWINHPKVSKREAFRECGNKYIYNSELSNYVNKRLRDDGLPLKHASGGRPKGVKNGKTLYSISDKNIYEVKYQEFLDYFHNTDLSQTEILEKMDTTNGTSIHKYIKRRLKEDGLSVKERFQKKQSKIMKETTKRKRLQRWDENYKLFKNYWTTTELYKKDIYKKIGVRPDRGFGEYVNKRLKEDGLPIQRKHYRKTNPEFLDKFYEEIKQDWYESDYNLYEYLEKFHNINKYTLPSKYLKNKATDDGLLINNKKVKDIITEDKIDEFYEEIKKEFSESNLSFNKFMRTKKIYAYDDLYKYYKNKLKQDKLLYNGYNINCLGVIKKINNGYSVYILNYYFGIYNSKDEAENVLNLARKNIFDENKLNELQVEYPSRKRKYPKKYESKYDISTIEAYNNSKSLLEQFYKDRNIQNSTRKGYGSTVIKFLYVTKKNSIDECIEIYFKEEENLTPIKDRSIKKDLMDYRSYLISEGLASQSIRSFFSKIKTLFRHFGVEIPELQRVKLKSSYVANYNDLPSHDMIRTACEQVNSLYKSIFLFMSSSGTAKAETLSITVEMFLKGFNKLYFDEDISNDNIYNILNLLKDKSDLVPLIYLRRIKTDKYYFTCCSPEASDSIIIYLLNRKNLTLDSKLFDVSSSKLSQKMVFVNDDNCWGFVGNYRRFRSHTLRKFMASNIKLPRDYVDALQGRSKDKIGEAYFKQDPKELRDIYISKMCNVMIYTDNDNTKNNSKNDSVDNMSIADELIKLSNLNKEGILTNTEFKNLKEKLLEEIL